MAFAFDVGRAGFQADYVRLLHQQFGGVLNGDNSLGVWNVAGQIVQQGGFTGAGSADDHDVQLGYYTGGDEIDHFLSD